MRALATTVLAVALDDAPVCDARGERATLMYWGGAERLNTSVRSALSVPFVLRKYSILQTLYYATQ